MNSQNRPDSEQPPQANPQNLPLSNEVAQSLLANQAAEIKNESVRLELQRRQLDHNAEYAKESLKYQAKDIESRPKETRRTILHISLIAAVFITILLTFVVYLLESGHQDLVTSILKGVGWVVSNGIAYYLGQTKTVKEKSTPGDTADAEVVN